MKKSLLAAMCLAGAMRLCLGGQSPDLMTLDVQPNTPITQGTHVTGHVTGAVPGAYLIVLVSALPGPYSLGLMHLDVRPPFLPIMVGPLDQNSEATLGWTSGPIPNSLSGHTLYVQALAVDVAQQDSSQRTWWVSNVDALVFGLSQP